MSGTEDQACEEGMGGGRPHSLRQGGGRGLDLKGGMTSCGDGGGWSAPGRPPVCLHLPCHPSPQLCPLHCPLPGGWAA